MKSVLVTGSNGMLGKEIVQALLSEGFSVTGISMEAESEYYNENFKYISADLTRSLEAEKVFKENEFTHVIHLAAIAHVQKGRKISWSRYYRVNTIMSRQIFECACRAGIPVFFASTLDVYGITYKKVNESTQPDPIGAYARSKYLAERALIKAADYPYLIARFAPVYTKNNQKDIQKRYYLKYPKVCYRIGKNLEYEFLSADKAAGLAVSWCKHPGNFPKVMNLCDDRRFNTKTLIENEQMEGRARAVIYIPQCAAELLRLGTKVFTGRKSLFMFNVSKVLNPITVSKI